MNVGFWLGPISLESGGTASYAFRVLDAVLNFCDSGNIKITVLCTHTNSKEIKARYSSRLRVVSIPYKVILLFRAFNSLILLFHRFLERRQVRWLQIDLLNPWLYLFKFLGIDLLHVPLQVSPYIPCNPQSRSGFICPLVITMHDLQEFHFPEFFTGEERLFRAQWHYFSIRYASKIVVSFSHVKDDIINYFQVDKNKVHVCSIPFSEVKLKQPSSSQIKIFEQSYAGFSEFLLYPAQTWPHKNHQFLIHAIKYIHDYHKQNLVVVCTGRKNNFFSQIKSCLDQNDVQDQFLFTDIVAEEELHWLYQNCMLVVIPTLYEAGSFPLIEAMSLGIPVICSRVTSLPETIGDDRFTFEPESVQGLAELILKIKEDSVFRYENIANGRKQIIKHKNILSAAHFFRLWNEFC